MCKYLMYNIRNPVCFYSGWIDPLWDESFELISGPFLQMGCSIPQTRLWCWTVILRWSFKKKMFPFLRLKHFKMIFLYFLSTKDPPLTHACCVFVFFFLYIHVIFFC